MLVFMLHVSEVVDVPSAFGGIVNTTLNILANTSNSTAISPVAKTPLTPEGGRSCMEQLEHENPDTPRAFLRTHSDHKPRLEECEKRVENRRKVMHANGQWVRDLRAKDQQREDEMSPLAESEDA
ncbi:unnamed protein product [Amoebophrya sp. A120]|nr:unnamed protein product [Amoebophrya sp. A120]|eukprot:GSA120T00024289001.1